MGEVAGVFVALYAAHPDPEARAGQADQRRTTGDGRSAVMTRNEDEKNKELGRRSRAWTKALQDREFAEKHGMNVAAQRLDQEAKALARRYRKAR